MRYAFAVPMFIMAMFVAAPSVSAQSTPHEAQVRIDGTGVVASGVTPGAPVFFFGASHEDNGYRLQVTEFAKVVTDDDRDGIVRYDIGRAVSSTSVWVAVDLRASRRGMGAGPRRVPVRYTLPPATLHPAGGAESGRVSSPSEATVFWVVRPGAGAWRGEVTDGGPNDADGTLDGRSTALLERFIDPYSAAPPPRDFGPGDLVFTLEPLSLIVTETVRGK